MRNQPDSANDAKPQTASPETSRKHHDRVISPAGGKAIGVKTTFRLLGSSNDSVDKPCGSGGLQNKVLSLLSWFEGKPIKQIGNVPAPLHPLLYLTSVLSCPGDLSPTTPIPMDTGMTSGNPPPPQPPTSQERSMDVASSSPVRLPLFSCQQQPWCRKPNPKARF